MHDVNPRGRSRSLAPRKGRTPSHTPARIHAAAGTPWTGLEAVEQRLLLDGDHPGLPSPWVPGQGDTITLDTASPLTSAARGRGTASGTITAGDSGDLFKFVVPQTAGRTKDFVTVLADTITAPNGTTLLNSTLDTRVEIYNNAGQLITTGANNGTLSIGLGAGAAPDAWAGFEADLTGDVSSRTYYVRVQRDTTLAAGRTATGAYTLRVDAVTVDLPTNTTPMTANLGAGSLPGTLAFRQDEIVYRVTTRDDPAADGVATFQAISDNNNLLNPHLDLYGSQMNQQGLRGFLRQDTDAGRLTDSFTWVRSNRAQTYYVRVRADELGPTGNATSGRSTGQFYVQVRTEPTVIDIDPQTRLGQVADAVAPLNKTFPPQPPPVNAPGAGRGLSVYKFTAQGTGAAIITAVSQQMPQPAIRVLDNNGNFLDFNKGNGLAQIRVPVVGGQTYFIIGEGFDNAANGDFNVFIEAHHTFDPFQPIDDHLDTPRDQGGAVIPNPLLWQDATPIRFGDPFQLTDPESQLPVRDRGWLQTGTGRGRIFSTIPGAQDTDLFQFVSPVPMMDAYGSQNNQDGDNNQNSALYVGGPFAQAGNDPRTGNPYDANNVGVYQAGGWFQAGPTRETTNNNPSSLNGPIFAMAQWDPDGSGGAPPVLAVGGRFTRVWNPLVNMGAGGNITLGNIAFRVFDQNTAQWVWSADPLSATNDNPVSLNGPVFALAAGDVIPADQQGLGAPELYVGGQFTSFNSNNILGLVNTPGGLGLTTLNGGATGGASPAVFAITVWDPPAPPAFPSDPTGGSGQAPNQRPDLPTQVFFGGSFTTVNSNDTSGNTTPAPDPADNAPVTNVGNVAHWGLNGRSGNALAFKADGLNQGYNITFGNMTPGTSTPRGFGVNGPVFSLAVWNDPGQRVFNGQAEEIPERLIIGGQFTSSGAVTAGGTVSTPPATAANNLIAYDYTRTGLSAIGGTTPVPATPRFQAVTGGAPGAVRALTTWHPFTVDGAGDVGTDTSQTFLVAANDAGAGGTLRVLNTSGVGGAWQNLMTADDGKIRTVVANQNNEIGWAPGVNADGTPSDFETLYVGGDFTTTDMGAQTVNGVARLVVDVPNGDVSFHPLDNGGVQNLSPGGFEGVTGPTVGTTTGVYALAFFNDNVAGAFDRSERQGSRVRIVVNKPADGATLNAHIRVYDSRFALVYENETISPIGQPDPAGGNDPSLTPNTQFIFNVNVFGGETYYIEVSGTGGSQGRYFLSVTTDALPPAPGEPTLATPSGPGVTPNTSGTISDDRSTYFYPVGEGNFSNAPEINLSAAGFGRNYLDPLGANPSSYSGRIWKNTAGGIQRTELWDTPILSRVWDTHLYFFRAPNNGTVDIRLATLGITVAQNEIFTDVTTGNQTTSQNAKVINSPLHGALRVFNNDFVQLGYSDSNPAVQGFGRTIQYQEQNPNRNPADNGVRTFLHSDPRLTVNVEAGKIYYIQVESAFRETFAQNPDLVDWRYATGAYDLLVNVTPSLNSVDDHFPDGFSNNIVDGFSGTTIPIDNATGAGTINGAIVNIPAGPFANPADADTFIYYAPSRGQVSVRVQATNNSLQPRVRILEDTTFNVLGTASAPPGGLTPALTFPTEQGQRFFIVVDGNGSQGTYTVQVSGPGFTDDYPGSTVSPSNDHPLTGWANPVPLSINRFQGIFGRPDSSGAVVPTHGVIENPGDRDTFKFTAEAYEFATVSVTSQDNTLDPAVTVWEITRDGQGRPVPTDKQVFVRVATNDDDPSVTGGTRNSKVTFSVTKGRDYYVVVQGSNEFSDFGRYTLTVSVAPTDDHPNLTDFPAGSTIDLTLDSINFTAAGSAQGTIGIAGDDDLFRFTAPATGSGTVTVTRRNASTLAIDLLVLDNNGVALPGVTITLAPDGSQASATLPTVSQGVQYYLLVRARGTLPAGTTNTGDYTVNVGTQPIDDYPNAGQFSTAASVPLSSVNAVGSVSGILVPLTDTDLFKFSTIAAGNVTVRITTPSSNLNPKVVIFDASQNQVFSANGNGDSATVSFNATAASQQFFVLVTRADGATGTAGVGTYTLTISGSLPGGGGGGGADDYPNAGEWADADARAVIPLDQRTGAGSVTANINPAADTDLFTFTAAGAGIVDIQVVTPAGGLVDGQVRLFDSNRNQIAFDAAGVAGSTAALRVTATAGQKFYVLVEPVGAATGSYTLRIAAQPLTHFLYFPEGFAGSTIDEFLPIVNPNAFDVSYQVFARYESGDNPDVPIFSGTIAANQRGGITVSTRNNQAGSLVRIGVPYSLEIRSSGKLGATFSHYDFNSSVGESFTDRTSTLWTFAEAHKDRNNYRDFLLFYNPGSTTANLNVTLFYTDGTTTSFTTTIEGLRRNGVAFDTDPRVTRNGRFGVRVTSDQPIVSSLTSYNLPLSGGDGVLGDADGGSTRGVVTNVSSGAGATSNLSILNANSSAATVTVTFDYARVDLPKVVRTYSVEAGRQFRLALSSLGLVAGQTVGISYTSSAPVTVGVTEYKLGDGDATAAATSAARSYFFGDLFVNPSLAGIKYIEQLGLYNPTGVAIDVAVKFLFADGSAPATRTFRVGANSFQFVAIDQQQPILSRPDPTAFSLVLDSATPFVASLTHYDLFLNGGWSALGAPLGLTTPLSSL